MVTYHDSNGLKFIITMEALTVTGKEVETWGGLCDNQ